MRAYSEAYLNDVVENQGKLFDLVSQNYPQKDTFDFINGKRVKLDCDYDEVLISHEGKCVAIYAKENNYYVSKRGLF